MEEQAPKIPSRLWYLPGPVVLVAGIVLTSLFLQWSERVPAPVETFETGETVEVTLQEEEGLTILLGDGWSHDNTTKCAVADRYGDKVSVTYGFPEREVVHEGEEFHPAYETSDDVPPGTYTVSCLETGGEPIHVGVAPADTDSERFHDLAVVPWTTGLAVCVIATVAVYVVRRRARARLLEYARRVR